MKRCCLNLPGNLTCLVTALAELLVEEDSHRRSGRLLSGVHNLDETRKTERNVNFSHTREVERTHGHLSTRFTNRVGCVDTDCLTRLDTGHLELAVDTGDNLLELLVSDILSGVVLGG